METTGNQSQREGETYAEFMDRLYRTDPIDYTAQARDEKGSFAPSSNRNERPTWSFRVPTNLARQALKFMREENMSITKYLTFTIHHHLHNQDKNG